MVITPAFQVGDVSSILVTRTILNARVAQLVERLVANQKVRRIVPGLSLQNAG
jgi:hypothetical protein